MRANPSFLLLSLLFALMPSLCVAAPASLYIEELTWTELRDLVAAGRTTAIIPVGGTEQNGPHMALGKHNVRVKLLADKHLPQYARSVLEKCTVIPRCLSRGKTVDVMHNT